MPLKPKKPDVGPSTVFGLGVGVVKIFVTVLSAESVLCAAAFGLALD
jgi:hypothetical protein